jgi:spore maturation protein CgeB
MKILIVGAWAWPQYEQAFASGLRNSGMEVEALSTSDFFTGFMGRAQKALIFPGLAMWRLNRAVFDVAHKQQSALVLFWRPTHIWPSTIKRLAKMGVKTVSYHNDDPFCPNAHGNLPWHQHFFWFWALRCMLVFNLNFFYRKINCVEAITQGAKHADVLLPYFLPWQDRPVKILESERQRFETDVVFVGHYEPDGRELSLRALIEAGIKVKLWGGGYWTREVLGDLYDGLAPIITAEGDDYAKALCGSKICLCFLSKLNRDTYTRRCFEIPACGGLMLAERTDDLLSFFKEDEEACFFSSNAELVQKVQWLLHNPQERERIAAAGLRRIWIDRHDVNSRAQQFISVINNSPQFKGIE